MEYTISIIILAIFNIITFVLYIRLWQQVEINKNRVAKNNNNVNNRINDLTRLTSECRGLVRNISYQMDKNKTIKKSMIMARQPFEDLINKMDKQIQQYNKEGQIEDNN